MEARQSRSRSRAEQRPPNRWTVGISTTLSPIDSPSAIWRVPVGGGDERPVVEGLSYSLNFVVGDKGLYFLASSDAPAKTSIDFYEFATGRRTTLLELGKEHWWGMALSPDQQSLLYSVVDSAGSNLMVVDKFR